ncbi:MAG: flagellar biosynthesis protein FlhF [Phycisphaerae bacterium]|nr:MAG: flagellar biosynthesis protein FlhF [Planctomycetota bacterium]GJQ25625.1 MAG: flagellar biosynthesis protein FlhF [Phycisphaerae bacterium]
MPEALARVKAALGRDAVILHTRSIQRGGLLGLGAHTEIEITATADSRVPIVRARESGESSRSNQPSQPSRLGVPRRPPDAGMGTLHAAPRLTQVDSGNVVPGPLPPSKGSIKPAPIPAAPRLDDAALLEEISAIRAMVEELSSRAPANRTPDVPAELVQHYSRVIGQQVADELAKELIDRVAEATVGLPPSERSSGSPEFQQRVEAELTRCIAEMMPPAEALTLRGDGQPTVIALVGPTGVGKTTTIAKLAANLTLREGRRAGLITQDHYRIAAVEQLATYARILRIPMEPVLTPQAMREAIQKLSSVDVILIDTAGRSQRDGARLAELKEFLAAAQPDQIHLVLSSTAGESALREAMERFAQVGARHVVFTKLDEAVGFGVLLNVLHKTGLRMSYFTTGQTVPDDIEPAAAHRVARLIVGGATADPEDSTLPLGAARRKEGYIA